MERITVRVVVMAPRNNSGPARPCPTSFPTPLATPMPELKTILLEKRETTVKLAASVMTTLVGLLSTPDFAPPQKMDVLNCWTTAPVPMLATGCHPLASVNCQRKEEVVRVMAVVLVPRHNYGPARP